MGVKKMGFWNKLKKQRFMIGLVSGAKAGVVGGLLLGLTLGFYSSLIEHCLSIQCLLFPISYLLFFSLLFGIVIASFLGLVLTIIIVKEQILVRTSIVIGILVGACFSLFILLDNNELTFIAILLTVLNIFWGVRASLYGANNFLEKIKETT
jgi:hypothetical protein